MFDALIAAFEAEPTDGEKVVLLRGEGRVFCAGVDLLRANPERLAAAEPARPPLRGHPCVPAPVVAAMQGDAIAGGAMMTLHCDLSSPPRVRASACRSRSSG